MKIKKIKASTDVIQELVIQEPACKYECAIQNILAAIDALAEVAKDDEVAKDSIANLSVVLLDLKGNC